MNKIIALILCAGLLASCASKNKTTPEASKTMTKKGETTTEKTATTTTPATETRRATLAEEMKCSLAKDIRTLAIESRTPKGCELTYTKHGEAKSMAQSEYGVSHCEKVRDRIKGNLEEAGFTCQ